MRRREQGGEDAQPAARAGCAGVEAVCGRWLEAVRDKHWADVDLARRLLSVAGAVLLQSLVAFKLCLIRPGVSLGVRLGVPPVSPRLSGNASARRVLLSPAPRPQRPLKFTG
jgi:hypothetical protein